MPWILKSAFTHQSATVTKLLNEGWEPFAVINTGQLKKNQPVLKIYFKKLTEPATTEVKIDVDSSDLKRALMNHGAIIAQLGADLKIAIDDLKLKLKEREWNADKAPGEEIKMWTPSDEDYKSAKPDNRWTPEVLPEVVVEQLPPLFNKDDDLDSVAQNEDEDYLKEDNPHGYRVVNEIPANAQPPARTSQQEATIASIRSISNTNITTSPVQPDGVIFVYVGSQVHRIQPNGDYTTDNTGAGTSSLTVQ